MQVGGQMKRIYVEKRPGFDAEARKVKSDIYNVLGIETDLRLFIRYDVFGMDEEDFQKTIPLVFSEPPVDSVYFDNIPVKGEIFGVELLPGQYDQRADSAAQCVQMLTLKNKPQVKCGLFYAFSSLKDGELEKIKKYLINPVESREATLDTFETLVTKFDIPTEVETLGGFISLSDEKLYDVGSLIFI